MINGALPADAATPGFLFVRAADLDRATAVLRDAGHVASATSEEG